jgi:rod shape determining protein RodA
MSPLSPITPPEHAPEPATATLRLPLDPLLTLSIIGLGIFSLVTLRVATQKLISGDPHYYIDRQGAYLIVGAIGMLLLSRVDYGRLRQLKSGIYALLILSILAVLALGHSAKGAQRAIEFPLFSFQASELGKVLLILALSALVVDRSRRLRERETTVLVMLAALIPALLVIIQPDLGSGMVYVTIAFTLLLVAGTSFKHLSALVALGVVSIALVLAVAPAVGVHLLKPFQVERLTAFLHPSSTQRESEAKEREAAEGVPDPAYQQLQSKIAIGAGQKTGAKEPGQIANGFVPESRTDFIFAAVGEQYGFVGSALLLSLYALLIWRTLRILTIAKDLFGSLIAGGVVGMVMFQVFVNVGMAIGIMPVTGVTLPLMSYGGSSVITTLLAVGLLQSIYVQARASEALKGRVPLSPERARY